MVDKAKKYTCPCCGYKTLDKEANGSYAICKVCFWEDDGVQFDNPFYTGGANKTSLIQAQQNFMNFGACEYNALQFVAKNRCIYEKDNNWKHVIDNPIYHIEQANIRVKLGNTKYIKDQHYIITINDIPLDEFVNSLTEIDTLDLISPHVNWDEIPIDERTLITTRFKSINDTTYLPILICPDDLDLYCTVILAQTIFLNDKVIWGRIGIDETKFDNIHDLGQKVKYFDRFTPLQFNKEEYVANLSKIFDSKYF